MPTAEVAVATTVADATTGAPLETSESSTETTTDQSTESSSGSTTETASETQTGSTQTSATSELPDTGFMDEVGFPMLAMLGVILFLTILLIKYLITSL
jgi:cobalamin biosynthesis Mg chelatase CobN